MITLFRSLISLAIASFATACVMPFESPLSFNVKLAEPPPAWLIVGIVQVFAFAAIFIASIGLFLFKRWAIYLGFVAAITLFVLALPHFDNGILQAIGMPGVALLSVFALAWLAALAFTRSAPVAARFSR